MNMVTSAEVPRSYTSCWDVDTGQHLMRAPPSMGSSKQQQHTKYNSSCNTCRDSRVKCSGGRPCKRCATLPGLPSCVYKISQRHGKRKATVVEAAYGPIDGSGSATSPRRKSASLIDEAKRNPNLSDLENVLQTYSTQRPVSESIPFSIASTINSDGLADDSVDLLPCTDASAQVTTMGCLDLLHAQCQQPERPSQDDNALESAAVRTTQYRSPSTSSTASLWLDSTCNCLFLNQQLLDRLNRAAQELEKGGIDQVLVLMQDVSRQLSEYRECPMCSSKGVQRLINMAMLHQNQVALLCAVAKSPSSMLWPSDPDQEDAIHPAPRFTLGVYQLTPEDDLKHKTLAILTMSRQVESHVTCFDDLVRAYQSMAATDDGTMSDFVGINLQWLFNVASDLKTRLRASIAILQRLEWAPMATELRTVVGQEPL